MALHDIYPRQLAKLRASLTSLRLSKLDITLSDFITADFEALRRLLQAQRSVALVVIGRGVVDCDLTNQPGNPSTA